VVAVASHRHRHHTWSHVPRLRGNRSLGRGVEFCTELQLPAFNDWRRVAVSKRRAMPSKSPLILANMAMGTECVTNLTHQFFELDGRVIAAAYWSHFDHQLGLPVPAKSLIMGLP